MKLGKNAGFAAILLAIPTLSYAGAREDVLRAMAGCAATGDDHARLACYDQLAPQAKSALVEPVKPPPTPEEQKSWFGFDMGVLFGNSPRQQTTPEQFGSEVLPAPPPTPGQPAPLEPIDSITAKVNDFAMSPFKKFVVFLDNGQVWQQLQADTGVAAFSKHGNTVTISRGALGSSNLSIDDANASYKVKRIK